MSHSLKDENPQDYPPITLNLTISQLLYLQQLVKNRSGYGTDLESWNELEEVLHQAGKKFAREVKAQRGVEVSSGDATALKAKLLK